MPEGEKTPLKAVSGANGAEGDRTLNLCIANAALSQLSYGPNRRNSGEDGGLYRYFAIVSTNRAQI